MWRSQLRERRERRRRRRGGARLAVRFLASLVGDKTLGFQQPLI